MLAYLHIPFCHRVCPYCPFYKHTPGNTPIGEFVEAVLAEARTRVPQLPAAPRTLYVGGGTPSMLSPGHLTKLLTGLGESIPFADLTEITLEANPATFDAGKARLFRDLGVTRVSLGIQSFAPHVLATLGREHTPVEAAESVHVLRAAGIPSVNIDLMFAVPGQTRDDWEQTLARARALAPDHVSAYNLTYEEDTAFLAAFRRGEMAESEEENSWLFHRAREVLTANGFDHYETSNYARPGHHSVHNRGYWQGEEYLGLGPSAVSTIGRTRTKNIADTTRYVAMIRTLGHAAAESEMLDDEAMRLERIALGLRTAEGIVVDLLDDAGMNRARLLAGEGLLAFAGDRLVLAPAATALADSIAAELA